MSNLTDRIINIYTTTSSIKAAASQCHISVQKVRKILLTSGIMPGSEKTRSINAMYASGISIQAIADTFSISTKAVAAHLPYTKGAYNSDQPTVNALRIRKHRSK